MNIWTLVMVALFVGAVWAEYAACKYVASRQGPIHLLAYVLMLFLPIPGILGMAEGGAIRKARKAERAGDAATLPAASDSASR